LYSEVWLFGWCGGLVPDLSVGDLVLADATIFSEGADEPETRLSHPPAEPLVAQVGRVAEELGLRLLVGPTLTSAQVLASSEQKRAGAATGAVAVEMEAGPLARWAVARSVPFVHLRVVLDPLVSPLPPTRLPTDEHGRAPRRALLVHALTHPREWPALWNLMRQARVARRTMVDVIRALTHPGGPLAPVPPA
jgi:purine-nucleoside phosphorylase